MIRTLSENILLSLKFVRGQNVEKLFARERLRRRLLLPPPPTPCCFQQATISVLPFRSHLSRLSLKGSENRERCHLMSHPTARKRQIKLARNNN